MIIFFKSQCIYVINVSKHLCRVRISTQAWTFVVGRNHFNWTSRSVQLSCAKYDISGQPINQILMDIKKNCTICYFYCSLNTISKYYLHFLKLTYILLPQLNCVSLSTVKSNVTKVYFTISTLSTLNIMMRQSEKLPFQVFIFISVRIFYCSY